MSNQLLREALEEMVRCAQKQNWRDNYPSAMAKAYAALDATKEAQPAAGEQVAPKEVGEVIVTLRDGMKCFAFEEYSEAYNLPEGLHHLYTSAPPAAAHEAVRDKVVLERLRDLYESAYGAGQNNPNGYSSLHDREWEVQDAFRAMRAQAGEGGAA